MSSLCHMPTLFLMTLGATLAKGQAQREPPPQPAAPERPLVYCWRMPFKTKIRIFEWMPPKP